MLSKHFLNIIFNRKNIQKELSIDPLYGDLIEYLLLHAVICLELTALCRTIYENETLDSNILDNIHDRDIVTINAAQYSTEINKSELVGLLLYRPDGTGIDMNDLSLAQIALLTLFCCGANVTKRELNIICPDYLSTSQFDDFVHACLYRVPRIENVLHNCLSDLSLDLRLNDEPEFNVNLTQIHEDVTVLSNDFNIVRRRFKFKRYYGYANGKKFPEQIICRTNLLKRMTVKEEALPGIALTNSFPGSRYKCSWDVFRGRISNLIIPSTAVYPLLTDLTGGRFLGRKLSYLYSGRTMLLWDFLILVICFIILSLFKQGESVFSNHYLKAVCSSGASVFSTSTRLVLVKVVYDLSHWIPLVRKLITNIRQASLEK